MAAAFIVFIPNIDHFSDLVSALLIFVLVYVVIKAFDHVVVYGVS